MPIKALLPEQSDDKYLGESHGTDDELFMTSSRLLRNPEVQRYLVSGDATEAVLDELAPVILRMFAD